MGIQDIYERLSAQLQRDEVIVVHGPTYNDFGELDSPARTDEYGNPLLEIRKRANLKDAKTYGWREYRPPSKPKGVRSAAPDTAKEKPKPKRTTRTRKRRTKKSDE